MVRIYLFLFLLSFTSDYRLRVPNFNICDTPLIYLKITPQTRLKIPLTSIVRRRYWLNGISILLQRRRWRSRPSPCNTRMAVTNHHRHFFSWNGKRKPLSALRIMEVYRWRRSIVMRRYVLWLYFIVRFCYWLVSDIMSLCQLGGIGFKLNPTRHYTDAYRHCASFSTVYPPPRRVMGDTSNQFFPYPSTFMSVYLYVCKLHP